VYKVFEQKSLGLDFVRIKSLPGISLSLAGTAIRGLLIVPGVNFVK